MSSFEVYTTHAKMSTYSSRQMTHEALGEHLPHRDRTQEKHPKAPRRKPADLFSLSFSSYPVGAMYTVLRQAVSGHLGSGPFELPLLVYIAITLVFFFASFALAIHQPPGPRRWYCLPAILAGPALHIFAVFTSGARPRSFLLWLWTFTVVIWTFHATSLLYIERSVISRPASGGWNWLAARKGWNNPRRVPAISTGSPSFLTTSLATRGRFILSRVLFILFTGAIWVSGIGSCVYLLKIRPRDLDPPTYLHFALDRAALLRVISVWQWVWSCYFLLTAYHFATSIIFVGVLGLDHPEEWPPLWGDLRSAHSVRAFWGKFWHRIGTASQLSYARALTSAVGLRCDSFTAKGLTSLCVFGLSGLTHAVANWATYSGRGRARDVLSRDAVFLLVNFAGGLVEVNFSRMMQSTLSSTCLKKHHGNFGAIRQYLGYVWVFFFFYCVVPPYQYPFLQETLKGFMPDIRINIQHSPIKR